MKKAVWILGVCLGISVGINAAVFFFPRTELYISSKLPDGWRITRVERSPGVWDVKVVDALGRKFNLYQRETPR